MDHYFVDWQNDDTKHEEETDFIKEHNMDHCVVEQNLTKNFKDLMMVESNPEQDRPVFSWDEILGESNKEAANRKFVPGLRRLPPFPKLSAITSEQQLQCLKVLCPDNPSSLELKPTQDDSFVYNKLHVTYAKEREEFMEWAKHLWATEHHFRVLRPKKMVEIVYDAEFDIKAQAMKSLPSSYTIVSEVFLDITKERINFDMTCKNILKAVNIAELPKISMPLPITKAQSIMVGYNMPKPCAKHPCRFVLPEESSMTMLPLKEVHKKLAKYALDNGVEFIASEKALKSLLEVDRGWTINLSVCEAFAEEGEKRNVVVLGEEVLVRKEGARNRTNRAFKHLMPNAIVPRDQKPKMRYESYYSTASDVTGPSMSTEHQSDEKTGDVNEKTQTSSNSDTEHMQTRKRLTRRQKKKLCECTCKEPTSWYPPPRSFKIWRLRNLETYEHIDVIVHCPHKLQNDDGEVLLEPIPEYQLDLGISELSEEKNKSLALSLHLRETANLAMVRVDGRTGEMVMTKSVNYEDLVFEQDDQKSDIAQTVSSVLSRLRHLLPGHYLLHREVPHGRTWLYAAGPGGGQTLQLDNADKVAFLPDPDEAEASTPPSLEPALLPWHMYHKILPCAFTPFEEQVVKKKPAGAKNRQPPAAMAGRKNKKTRGKRGKR